MKNTVIAVTCLVLCVFQVYAYGQKVASFAYGRYGHDDFELLQFWSDNKIIYTYGSNGKQITLSLLSTLPKQNALVLKFPNGHRYVVKVRKSDIVMKGMTTEYFKSLAWYYEGPVNGVGTYCSTCTQSPQEATALVKKHYLKN